MRVTVLTIVALVGLVGLPASIAGEITVFLARPNVDQNLQQDDVVKPNDRIQTRDGGLVILVESETVTDPECRYWTVIPANTTHLAKSLKGRGCGNDTGALDRALASAESGEGQIVNAAFRVGYPPGLEVVHPPALERGDQMPTESQKAVSRFEAALREISLEPPETKRPSVLILDPLLNPEAARKAALEKERAAEALRAAREREEEMRRRRGGKSGKGTRDGGTPRKGIDADAVPSDRKASIAMAVIKGMSVADLSESTGLPAGTIEEWHRRFVAGGQAGLAGTVSNECDEAISELREKLGEMVVENGRLRDRCG